MPFSDISFSISIISFGTFFGQDFVTVLGHQNGIFDADPQIFVRHVNAGFYGNHNARLERLRAPDIVGGHADIMTHAVRQISARSHNAPALLSRLR